MKIYIYHVYSPICFDGKWSYGMGKLRKKLITEEQPKTSAARKELFRKALRTIDNGTYEIRGRSGKYGVFEPETGRPVWYIYAEE